MIKTKTIATIGPASCSQEMLSALISAGADVLRLNFSHGTLEEHAQALAYIRQIAAERNQAVAVMGDLSGPKIRIGEVDSDHSVIRPGEQLIIQRQPTLGNNERVSTTYAQMIDEVQTGQRVLVDDGKIKLQVESKTSDQIVCRCLRGGMLATHKGINLPDTDLDIPALTQKDLMDLEWAISNRLDFIALSFVRQLNDLKELRRHLDDARSDLFVIAKIEKPQAITHLDAIIDEADGILVARGDLGVEMDLEKVPTLQKDMTLRCQKAGKVVIIATQMLQSMVKSATPTRAEVSDVANAILDSTDAVMLSAESAIGDYPVEAVSTLQIICEEAEAFQLTQPPAHQRRVLHKTLQVTSSIASSARLLAEHLQPVAIAVWTQSGNSARLLSKHRFRQPIIALTENTRTFNKLALHYGVIPVQTACPQDTLEMLQRLDQICLSNSWASHGDHLIVVAGTHFKHTGGNNTLIIQNVGHV